MADPDSSAGCNNDSEIVANVLLPEKNKNTESDVNDPDLETINSDNGLSNENKTSCENTESESTKPFAVPLSLSTNKAKVKLNYNVTNKTKSEKINEALDKQPTEATKLTIPSSVYQEPDWSGLTDQEYSFDVLKNGSIIDTVCLTSKPFYIFGRLPSCDITLEHPSLSRYHAVVQFSTKDKGWFVYDLDSTHGTWVNKNKISPKKYHRLKVGYIIKFGGSSRLHILQGPPEDLEEESEMTITEMKAQKEKFQKEAELLRQIEMQEEMQRIEAEKKMLEDRGCGWGMDDDAEETEEGENAFASLIAENESLYIDDPKKALKGFYEREGCDLPDYQFTEIAMGKHKCRLELPVDGPNGEELVAEAIVSGKRKDAVVACALEACRILDRLGLLRSSTHESRKRKQKKWEDDDFYDSDEDTFLDRTGTIEKKRVMRMKKAGKDEPETYDSLLEKYNKVSTQIQDIENKLQKAKADAEALASEEMDELDAYMVSIKSGAMDTKTRMKLKGDLLKLKVEEQKLRKLVNIAKPALLPPLQPFKPSVAATTPVADVLSRKLHSQQKQNKKVTPVRKQAQVDLKPDDFQEEDDDDEEDLSKESSSIPTDITSESPNKASDNEVPPSPNNTGLTAIKDKSSKSEKTTKNIVKGPSLPPPKTEEKPVKKSDSVHQTSTRSFLKSLDKSQAASKPKPNPNFDSADPDYAMWLPPSEQSGDGRTSLNDKLGY